MAGDLKQHFMGRHLVNRRLTGPGSAKDTRHHEISLEGAPVSYLPGDALGLVPQNHPALVERIIEVMGATGDEPIAQADGTTLPFHHLLSDVYNLSQPSRRLFELLVARGSADLAPLMEKANAEQLKHYLNGWNEAHDVLDVLESHADIPVTPAELIDCLRKILPRLYSIASSLKAHPDQVHLLVVAVNFTIRERERHGITSTWLAHRWAADRTWDLYLQNQQKHFAMPADPDVPMIMIGPGTGLAPFRAFVEERLATGARGRNWLFFGEQKRATDYFYEEEFERYARDGQLRLDLAFSRDQADKIYVQHRMREQARDLWDWLQAGAEFFVCGDKERMAADVDRELVHIAETIGGKSHDDAKAYVDDLRHTKRYKRDVY